MAKNAIPKKVHNGEWWVVPAYVRVECPRCGETTPDRPAVMRYRPEMDADRGVGHEDWARVGWLVWWACGACGSEWHKGRPENHATTEQVASWLEPLKWETTEEYRG